MRYFLLHITFKRERKINMRRLIMSLVTAAALGALAAPGAIASPGLDYAVGGGATMKTFCAPGTIVVNVTMNVANDADVGLASDAWALDKYQRQIQVIQTAPNTFCAATRYSGTFGTLFGISPGATGFVRPGISSIFAGGDRFTFQGQLREGAPTSGSIGTFDYRCDASFVCPGKVDWRSLLFTNVTSFRTLWWSFGYVTSDGHGTWANRMDYSYGDITS
jgi:hypothetical protein